MYKLIFFNFLLDRLGGQKSTKSFKCFSNSCRNMDDVEEIFEENVNFKIKIDQIIFENSYFWLSNNFGRPEGQKYGFSKKKFS